MYIFFDKTLLVQSHSQKIIYLLVLVFINLGRKVVANVAVVLNLELNNEWDILGKREGDGR